MEEVAQWWVDVLKWIVGAGAAIIAIRGWVISPIKRLQTQQNTINLEITNELQSLKKNIGVLQEDVADVLGERLGQAYHHYMKIGWCTQQEKQYYIGMHARYSAHGHNHLAEKYEEDLIALPERPPKNECEDNE